ncbi:PREDICTED: uncharacterized protein LOC108978959 [Bactrocera latifrons]|uniref:uncharacterized protein LOC108978959 n=1 Tax=Bactrocera latifrons TaxID=174628 RepID=UPI0008DCDCA3|nr:PREDICTED: uncharacterized protein LOC108978959 [Bactrocera latifrons]
MNFKIYYARACLTFLLICVGNYITVADAKPAVTYVDGYFDRIEHDYIVPYRQPITDYHLSRLRRGYYYVEDGYITAIPESLLHANRRVDTVSSRVNSARSNAAKNNRTNGKHKKLFVPNLFG